MDLKDVGRAEFALEFDTLNFQWPFRSAFFRANKIIITDLIHQGAIPYE